MLGIWDQSVDNLGRAECIRIQYHPFRAMLISTATGYDGILPLVGDPTTATSQEPKPRGGKSETRASYHGSRLSTHRQQSES